MQSVSKMMRLDKLQIFLWAVCISFVGLTVPFPPRNVTIDVKPHHILVTWDPPMEANKITMYVVSYSILPDSRIIMNHVTDGLLLYRIPVEGQEGRLFKIHVQARNQVGVGNPSAARYVRIACGRTIWLDPSASTSLTFPVMEGTYKTGVLCQWTLATKETCFLTFTFVTLQLALFSNTHCMDAYVNIGNKGPFCYAQDDDKSIVSRDSNTIVIFNSGTGASWKGFHLKIRSIKVPGPPTLIMTQSNDNAIFFTWTPPTELALPITSYVIRYSVQPDGLTFSEVIEPFAFFFRIHTKHLDGKKLLINITARIEDVEGTTSDLLYVRVLKPPGPPTSITSKFNGNSFILSWAPPKGSSLPITSYIIRYTVRPTGHTYKTFLEPNIFHFSIDTTQFDGKYLCINITATIEDVEGVSSDPLIVKVETSRPTDLKTPDGQTGLTKSRFSCAKECLYSVVAAIFKEGIFASLGVLGAIAGTAANLLWDFFWGSDLNFLNRVKDYIQKWLSITGLSKGIIKVFTTCWECFN